MVDGERSRGLGDATGGAPVHSVAGGYDRGLKGRATRGWAMADRIKADIFVVGRGEVVGGDVVFDNLIIGGTAGDSFQGYIASCGVIAGIAQDDIPAPHILNRDIRNLDCLSGVGWCYAGNLTDLDADREELSVAIGQGGRDPVDVYASCGTRPLGVGDAIARDRHIVKFSNDLAGPCSVHLQCYGASVAVCANAAVVSNTDVLVRATVRRTAPRGRICRNTNADGRSVDNVHIIDDRAFLRYSVVDAYASGVIIAVDSEILDLNAE